MTLRLLSYNIRLGGSGREKAIAAVIDSCQPDLVVLQEAVIPEVVEKIATFCRFTKWGSVRGHSVAFLSRVDISHYAWHQVWGARRQYLEIVLAGSNTRIFGVHLSAIHSNVTERRRYHELSSLLTGIAQHQHGFHVITGDFNTLAPGEELDLSRLPLRLRAITWLTGRKIRWTTIQLMLDRGYKDGYRLFHSDKGYTFPVWDPHVRLDYAFVPEGFANRIARCEVMTTAASIREASDHLPLHFEIVEA